MAVTFFGKAAQLRVTKFPSKMREKVEKFPSNRYNKNIVTHFPTMVGVCAQMLTKE